MLEQGMKYYERGIWTEVSIAAEDARLGDRERAYEWLEKGLARHDQDMSGLRINSAFDSLRNEPRFRDILRRIGLPE